MEAWLYDEDCWPSGTAGGLVAARHADCQAKQLRMDVLEPGAFEPVDNIVEAIGRATAPRAMPKGRR